MIPMKWAAWSVVGFMAITVSLGEAVAICALLVTILGAVLGTYVAIIRRLDAQDGGREALAVALEVHRTHVNDVMAVQAEETKNIRRRLHDIAQTVNGMLLQAANRERREDRDGR